ncbi:Cytochrome c oxidase subunit 6 [Boothiomyces sp. JEL0866]|nr:Cytochrome c oxidase subunit 6 [Boothiomyces sp. JEL0866]
MSDYNLSTLTVFIGLSIAFAGLSLLLAGYFINIHLQKGRVFNVYNSTLVVILASQIAVFITLSEGTFYKYMYGNTLIILQGSSIAYSFLNYFTAIILFGLTFYFYQRCKIFPVFFTYQKITELVLLVLLFILLVLYNILLIVGFATNNSDIYNAGEACILAGGIVVLLFTILYLSTLLKYQKGGVEMTDLQNGIVKDGIQTLSVLLMSFMVYISFMFVTVGTFACLLLAFLTYVAQWLVVFYLALLELNLAAIAEAVTTIPSIVQPARFSLIRNIQPTIARRHYSDLDPADKKDYQAFVDQWQTHFKTVDDDFELERGLNHIFAADWVPSVEVVSEALRASRRLNTFATAVRILEGLKDKAYKKEQYDAYIRELKPLLDEYGIVEKEDLGEFQVIRDRTPWTE